MKTRFDDIVRIDEIGRTNSMKLNDLLALAKAEELVPASEDKERVMVIGIDFQNDFMENGELGVPNSHQDIRNITNFIYKNLNKITTIAVSLDTHDLHQIFHPSWWMNREGNHPVPFTIITADDVEEGIWIAVEKQKESLDYLRNLEKIGKKQLCIWTYHCIEGTNGAALEGQFSNMIHFHSIARNTKIEKIVKGQNPLSEMYGMIKPEYAVDDEGNYEFLSSLKSYKKIIIAGEAKSHCVLESVKQIVEHYTDDRSVTTNIYLLNDCMSPIPSYEEETEKVFEQLKLTYGIHIVNSTDLLL
ncbi:hypothetical protein [Bacillus cereus]|uniref:Nicotinamidase n=1 Tax=Bacillus cereus TaxID=1396 RepID=A0A2A7HTA9_BACCE|nr:hypothetical protein [Bacillus cereus]PEC20409.1 hypothetical protein COM96_19430 [Bacillus cereus]